MGQQQPKCECYYDRFLRETDSAILIEKDNKRYWIPKSQIGEFDHQPGARRLTLPQWLIKMKGLSQ